MSRTNRRTAREIANLPSRGGWFGLVLIGIGLLIILFFKFSMSDQSSEVFRSVVGNPELELPVSATEQPVNPGAKQGQAERHGLTDSPTKDGRGGAGLHPHKGNASELKTRGKEK